jgi:hypothetical protein
MKFSHKNSEVFLGSLLDKLLPFFWGEGGAKVLLVTTAICGATHPPTRGGRREEKKKKVLIPRPPISGATYSHENYNPIIFHFLVFFTLFDFLILINK